MRMANPRLAFLCPNRAQLHSAPKRRVKAFVAVHYRALRDASDLTVAETARLRSITNTAVRTVRAHRCTLAAKSTALCKDSSGLLEVEGEILDPRCIVLPASSSLEMNETLLGSDRLQDD
jgi:hypothetical protein